MSYIDAKNHSNQVHVWYRDNGKLVYKKDKLPLYCYVKNINGPYKTLYGEPVNKVTFDRFWDYKEFIENHNDLFESDIEPVYKYLSDNFYKVNPDEPMNIGYWDIEVHPRLERGKGYPTPEDPHGEILSISLYIKFENRYHFFYLYDHKIDLTDEFEGLEVKHHQHTKEIDMLMDFIHTISDVDALADWNGEVFDIPMLINRLKRLLGEDYALKALCRNDFSAFERWVNDDYGNKNLKYDLVGRAHFDMLQLYKRFEGSKMSLKLDNVAHEELGEDYMKVDYQGTIQDFYENEPERFFRYSLVDTQILKWIDEKKKHLDLAIQMARTGTVRYKDVLGSLRQIEMGIRNFVHYDLDDPVVLNDRRDQSKTGKIKGAYVFPTKIGRHSWGFTQDLSALYPSVICSLNLSPETFVFQCTKKEEDLFKIVQETNDLVVLEDVQEGDYIKTSAKEVKQIIKDEGLSISANGSLFRNDFRGIIPLFVERGVELRNHYKKLMKTAENDSDKSKYNIYQLTLKEINNSVYGVLINEFCRFFNLDLGQSITLTGQHINRFQAIVAKELIDNEKQR